MSRFVRAEHLAFSQERAHASTGRPFICHFLITKPVMYPGFVYSDEGILDLVQINYIRANSDWGADSKFVSLKLTYKVGRATEDFWQLLVDPPEYEGSFHVSALVANKTVESGLRLWVESGELNCVVANSLLMA
jgi:hypothetical protein